MKTKLTYFKRATFFIKNIKMFDVMSKCGCTLGTHTRLPE